MRSRDRRLMSLEGNNNNNNNSAITSSSTNGNNRQNGGNFVTRSWARISGRRKKQPRPPPIEEGIEINEEPIPSTSSSQQIPWKLANHEEKPK
uniref:Uncharacterized protein n=1 Tax=Panagrolaimus sp. ES5 TaxID=591445 RepID=A0AC34G564_9BILA